MRHFIRAGCESLLNSQQMRIGGYPIPGTQFFRLFNIAGGHKAVHNESDTANAVSQQVI